MHFASSGCFAYFAQPVCSVCFAYSACFVQSVHSGCSAYSACFAQSVYYAYSGYFEQPVCSEGLAYFAGISAAGWEASAHWILHSYAGNLPNVGPDLMLKADVKLSPGL